MKAVTYTLVIRVYRKQAESSVISLLDSYNRHRNRHKFMAKNDATQALVSAGSLQEIIHPVKYHLDEFQTYFRNSVRSNVSLLDLIVRYIARQKGKRVRPALVFLAAELCGGITERSYIGATMVELLHTATLVHDDVVDDAEERRGVASINAVWKNKAAVLVGDFFLSRGLLISVENGEYDFLRVTSTAVKRMSEGELLQIQKSRQKNIDEQTYFQIIADKTASLLSTCCEVGAMSASPDIKSHEAMRLYGEHCGLAFQIRDDILDYISRTTILGKPVGNDLREKKITLPLIYACSVVVASEAKKIIRLLKSGKITNEGIEYVHDFVKRNGGIEYSIAVAQREAEKAIAQLAYFPESQAKQSLTQFAYYVIHRKK